LRYRRSFSPGGTFFFTVVTYQRRKIFVELANIELLVDVTDEIRQRHPFKIIAQVILPDHLHTIWELPREDTDYPTRWRLIKSLFTRRMEKHPHADLPPSRLLKGEQAVWQRRYWEHQIRDDEDLERHIEYIHFNPVHHGLVKLPVEWPSSSFQQYVKDGIYDVDWASVKQFGDRKDIGGE